MVVEINKKERFFIMTIYILIHNRNETAGFSTAVGMFPIGGMVGSFATSFMVTKFGRKGAQMCNMFISILGGALYILSYYLAK